MAGAKKYPDHNDINPMNPKYPRNLRSLCLVVDTKGEHLNTTFPGEWLKGFAKHETLKAATPAFMFDTTVFHGGVPRPKGAIPKWKTGRVFVLVADAQDEFRDIAVREHGVEGGAWHALW